MTYETLKTKLREVLEKTQELSKENGKDDTELRDFAVSQTGRNSATATGRRISGDSIVAAVEVQDDEAAKSGLAKLCPTMQQTKYVDVVNSKWASQT